MRLIDERPVVLRQGVFKRTGSPVEAMFLITGMTIGAGVLGLPYAVARAGVVVGLLAIAIFGLVMLGLNLMIGELAARTRDPLQIPGLAARYLGTGAGRLLTVTFLFTGLGALLAYLVGAGATLSALLGGSNQSWSVLFWLAGSLVVARGLGVVKYAEKYVSTIVMLFLAGLSIYALGSLPAVPATVAASAPPPSGSGAWLLLSGVIIFALRASPSIAQAEAVLPGNPAGFKRAVAGGTLLPIGLYLLFSYAVVRATGIMTTEVATVGLGATLGRGALVVGNILATLAMGGAFIGLSTAVRESLQWDFKLSRIAALGLTLGVPLLLFLAGLQSFIRVLEVVGGVFVGLEAVVITLVYLRARRQGDVVPAGFAFKRPYLVALPVMAIFGFFTVAHLVRILF